ncbi:MAG: hypothetical protein ABJA98_23565 [Acidobacteriota bacterium]
MTTRLMRTLACVAIICAIPSLASAQLFEMIGIRAQGMAGAFVAVADDASATWWNPAGLASGAFFSGIVERGAARSPRDDAALGVAFVVPSLGLSYYRLRISEQLGVPGGGAPASLVALDPESAAARLPTFVVNELGASFGQSIGDHLVLASTLRLVWADQVRGDIDIGAMLRAGGARIGFVVKHLHEPDLTADGMRLASFDRQVRVGAAYLPHPGMLTLNAALDADLTTTQTVFGNARHLAGGGELWIDRRLALRGGVSVNTVDELRRSFSAGASAAIQKAFFLDAQLTRGDDPAKEGWGLGLRVTF